jgi:hypothetical protein
MGSVWLRRQADLRRIYALREANKIDGLYSLSRLGEFRLDVEEAVRRLG